jgi:predicted outer membrane repeat protein
LYQSAIVGKPEVKAKSPAAAKEPEDVDETTLQFMNDGNNKATFPAAFKSSKIKPSTITPTKITPSKIKLSKIKHSKCDTLVSTLLEASSLLKGLLLLMAAVASMSFSMGVAPGQCVSKVLGLNQPGIFTTSSALMLPSSSTDQCISGMNSYCSGVMYPNPVLFNHEIDLQFGFMNLLPPPPFNLSASGVLVLEPARPVLHQIRVTTPIPETHCGVAAFVSDYYTSISSHGCHEYCAFTAFVSNSTGVSSHGCHEYCGLAAFVSNSTGVSSHGCHEYCAFTAFGSDCTSVTVRAVTEPPAAFSQTLFGAMCPVLFTTTTDSVAAANSRADVTTDSFAAMYSAGSFDTVSTATKPPATLFNTMLSMCPALVAASLPVNAATDFQTDGCAALYSAGPVGTVDYCMSISCGSRANAATDGQTSSTFNSKHETRWGGDCPGHTSVTCTDDPDTGSHAWTNTEGHLAACVNDYCTSVSSHGLAVFVNGDCTSVWSHVWPKSWGVAKVAGAAVGDIGSVLAAMAMQVVSSTTAAALQLLCRASSLFAAALLPPLHAAGMLLMNAAASVQAIAAVFHSKPASREEDWVTMGSMLPTIPESHTPHTGSLVPRSLPIDVEAHNWTEANSSICNITSGLSGTVMFTTGFNCSDYNEQITIAGHVTILGSGAVCDAGGKGRFFHVNSGASLALDSITLTNGLCNSSTNCSRGEGGAITNYGALHVNSTTFEKNNAQFNGGAVYNNGSCTVQNSHFLWNGKIRYGGGAVLNDAGTLYVNSSSFKCNGAEAGGAIFNKNGHCEVDNSNFTSNYATGGGGAIDNQQQLSVGKSMFVSNQALFGGAIHCSAAGSGRVVGCVFNSNTAVAHSEETKILKIATGGAIACEGGPTNISTSNFSSNRADSGGAVSIVMPAGEFCPWCSPGATRISRSHFSHNNASNGAGGALLCSGSLVDLVSSELVFEDNCAESNGGGVSVEQTRSNIPANLDIGCNTDANNQGCNYTGPKPGQCTCDTCLSCEECLSGVCKIPDIQGFWNPILKKCRNKDGDGYDIGDFFSCPQAACFASSNASNGTHTFRKYTHLSQQVPFKSSIFTKNSAKGSGGAVYLENVDARMPHCNMTENTATTDGGAVYLAGSSTLKIQSQMSRNRAGGSGAAIHSSTKGSIVLQNGTVLDISDQKSGLTIASGGDFIKEPGSVVQCGVGEELLNGIHTAELKNGDWQINCSIPTVDIHGNVSCLDSACDAQGFDPFHPISESCKGIRPLMTYYSGTVGCSPCQGYTYTLGKGQFVGEAAMPSKCHPCPFGAECSSDGSQSEQDVRVKEAFWAHKNTSSPEEIVVMACPAGYCCYGEVGCIWNTDAACQGNRDWKSPLCGACLDDFSLSIDGSGCIENSRCGQQSEMAKYAAFQLLSWLGLCALFLYQGRFHSLMKRLPLCCWSRPKDGDTEDGVLSVLIYFYQLAAIAVPQGKEKVTGQASGVFCILPKMVGTNPISGLVDCTGGVESGNGSGFCIQGLSFVTIRLCDLAVPLVLWLLLHFISAGVLCCQRRAKDILTGNGGLVMETLLPCLNGHCDNTAAHEEQPEEEVSIETDHQHLPLQITEGGQDSDEEESLLTHQRHASSSASQSHYVRGYYHSPVDSFKDGHQEQQDDGRKQVEQQQGGEQEQPEQPGPIIVTSIAPAVSSMLLYCYTMVTGSVIKLLHCVDVEDFAEGPQQRLFFAGKEPCDFLGWQLPILILLGVLVMLPTLPVTIWVLQHALPPSWETAMWISASERRMRAMEHIAVIEALVASMAAPFNAEHWHWGALLVLQRLLMVSVGTFLNVVMEASLGMVFVALWFMLLHVYSAPYKSQQANTVQAVASVCLLGITILNSIPSGFTSTGFDPAGTLDYLEATVYAIMFSLLLVPLLAWAMMLAVQHRANKQMDQTGATSTYRPGGGPVGQAPPPRGRWATSPPALPSIGTGQHTALTTPDHGEPATEGRVASELFAAMQAEHRLELENRRLKGTLGQCKSQTAMHAQASAEHIARLQRQIALLKAQGDNTQRGPQTQITPHMAATPERAHSRMQQRSQPSNL